MLLKDGIGLRMKNSKIEVHWKINFLSRGVYKKVYKKPIYRWELPKTRGLGKFANLKRALYWGVDTTPPPPPPPMHTMVLPSFYIKDKLKSEIVNDKKSL